MSNSTSSQIKHPKLLIVEGRDEVNFFGAALANHLGITDIQVMGIGGKTLLNNNLAALVMDPVFPTVQCLAVIRDADLTPPGAVVSSAASAFQSVSAVLSRNGLTSPMRHGDYSAGPPRVGIFIIPDGSSDGMLETLCMSSVSGHPAYPCVTDFFACCQNHGSVPNNMHKARAHAWLASRLEPDRRVGEAALAGDWPFADPAFQPLWTFLQAM